MPFQKGKSKTGGRKKGVLNKVKEDLIEKLERLGCDPIQGMSTIAENKLPCGVCRGAGKTKYKLPDGTLGTRTCESCYGTLFEACSPELRGKMHAELAQYVYPKRRAIDLTNSDGSMSLADILQQRREKRADSASK